MAIIKNSQETSIFKAFLINAFITALIATLIVKIRRDLDDHHTGIFRFFDKVVSLFDPDPLRSDTRKLFYTFLTGFLLSLILYNVLFILIGFGGGMLTNKRHHNYF